MNLKELSKNLGLSQTTVSRALNGYPEVSEATRHRVQSAARQFNYIPSTLAKGLATGKAMAVGHVIPMSSKHEMVNPIFGDFIAGAGEIYARHGYEMVISIVNENENEANIYESLQSRKAVDGVVVHGPRYGDERIPLLQDIGMPFVVHGRASSIERPYAWLDVNNRRAFEKATHYLVDLGHRHIALINGLESMDFAYRRRAGYEQALKCHDIAFDPALYVTDEMTEALGYHSTLDMLNGPTPPTAILCASMVIAFGVRRAVEAFGLKVGTDISIIAHDDNLSYLQNGGDVPIFTATRSSVRDAGRRVAQMLLGYIADPTQDLPQTLLEAELIIGQSTGPAPLARKAAP